MPVVCQGEMTSNDVWLDVTGSMRCVCWAVLFYIIVPRGLMVGFSSIASLRGCCRALCHCHGRRTACISGPFFWHSPWLHLQIDRRLVMMVIGGCRTFSLLWSLNAVLHVEPRAAFFWAILDVLGRGEWELCIMCAMWAVGRCVGFVGCTGPCGRGQRCVSFCWHAAVVA